MKTRFGFLWSRISYSHEFLGSFPVIRNSLADGGTEFENIHVNPRVNTQLHFAWRGAQPLLAHPLPLIVMHV